MFDILEEHTRKYKKENQDVYTTLAETGEGYIVLIANRKERLSSFQFGASEQQKTVAQNFFEELTKCFERWRFKETFDFLQNLIQLDKGVEAYLFVYTSTNGDLSEVQCRAIIEYLELDVNVCDDEAFGEKRVGWKTIQLATEDEDTYFGEFIGEVGKVNFQFINYQI